MSLKFWTMPDIAAALGITPRTCEAMLRDPECPHVPVMGYVGNSRIYDPGAVPLKALRKWVADTPTRTRARQLAAMERQKHEARERAAQKLENKLHGWADANKDAERQRRVPEGYMASEAPTPKRHKVVTADSGYMREVK